MGRHTSPEILRQRLLAKRLIAPSGCWIWCGLRFSDGYGQVNYKNRPLRVHRAAMELWNGEPGMLDKTSPIQVLHRCDTPLCFNPDHLWLGDPKANNGDRDAKGRGYRGEGHAWTKLTVDQVREIRELAAGGVTQQAIADRFHVTQGAIGSIVRRRSWRWLD